MFPFCCAIMKKEESGNAKCWQDVSQVRKVIDLARYSSLPKVLRAIAYINRSFDNLE